MLDALAAGQRDPAALAALARGRMRPKIARIEEALDCSFFTSEHAGILAMMLAVIDHCTARIEELTARIEELMEPWANQAAQLDEIDGIGATCAQEIIAEIGTDMTVFPTAAHLVSWARWSPGVRESAGKRKGSSATGRGNPYLGAALGEAAAGAGRTQSFLGARYRRLTRRMPKKKALVATGSSMLTIIHALLSDPEARYRDLGADYHEQRISSRRQARTHIQSLERLGYAVTIQALSPGTAEPLPAAG
jgi:transposase